MKGRGDSVGSRRHRDFKIHTRKMHSRAVGANTTMWKRIPNDPQIYNYSVYFIVSNFVRYFCDAGWLTCQMRRLDTWQGELPTQQSACRTPHPRGHDQGESFRRVCTMCTTGEASGKRTTTPSSTEHGTTERPLSRQNRLQVTSQMLHGLLWEAKNTMALGRSEQIQKRGNVYRMIYKYTVTVYTL